MQDIKSCWLSTKLHSRLKALAAIKGATVQALLDQAVREYLETNKKETA